MKDDLMSDNIVDDSKEGNQETNTAMEISSLTKNILFTNSDIIGSDDDKTKNKIMNETECLIHENNLSYYATEFDNKEADKDSVSLTDEFIGTHISIDMLLSDINMNRFFSFK